MKVFPRVQLGQPILRQKAKRLTKQQIQSTQTQDLIKRMYYTLRQTGGIGLAAPQIGVGLQLAVVNVAPKNKNHTSKVQPPKKRERFVMINPKIISSSKKHRKMHEGCLSFSDLFGEVSRPSSVTVTYIDETGTTQQRTLSGLVATVFQHEYDHLQGVVWIDRLVDSKTVMTASEYRKQKLTDEIVEELI